MIGRNLIIIFVNIVLYATCFQLQRPLEPFIVEKFSKDSQIAYANLQTFFSCTQMVGSLIVGKMIDRVGIKGGFLITFLSSALSYWLLSCSTELWILYVSKIPTLFQAGFLCAQVAVSKETKVGTERITALGRLTTSYTIGMIVGPTVGGYLGVTGDYVIGARLAVVGSLISAILSLFLQDSAINSPTPSQKTTQSSTSIFEVAKLVWPILLTKFITGFANSLSGSAGPIIMKERFRADELLLGFSMSLISFLNAIISAFFLDPIVKKAEGRASNVVSVCLGAMVFLSIVQAFSLHLSTTGLTEFLFVSLLLSVCQFIISPLITSESTALVGASEQGTLIGAEHSLFALARIFGPHIGVRLFLNYDIAGVAGGSALFFLLSSFVWKLHRNPSLQTKLR